MVIVVVFAVPAAFEFPVLAQVSADAQRADTQALVFPVGAQMAAVMGIGLR
jgi:hypothetical protein